jgi:hypothetical protein|tara:strand:+ start:1422 stop:2027 length:606 start_codon:yes stop_codon:yes gene_type:complete
MLSFDALTHTYTVNGRAVPSVTARIAAAGLLGPAASFYTAHGASRGQRVHLACRHLDEGTDITLPPGERGYLRSYERWRDAMRPRWTALEEPHYSATYKTAGTADRLGVLQGPVVVDLKTGGATRWHGIQLACYDLLHEDLAPRERRRLVLHLSPDGRMAQSVEYHDAHDYLLALELLEGHTDGPNRPDDRACPAGIDGQP